MQYQHLLYSHDDRVTTITLNRPERHNALSVALVDEIIRAVAQADADPETRVVIVTGAGGRAFSSGYDIKESAEKPKRTTAEWRARMQKDIQFTYSVWDCTKPVIALVDGFCIAGALEFAMCCDTSRGRMHPIWRPSGSQVSTSFIEWTAMSISSRRSACSSSFVKRPLPPIAERGLSRTLSATVVTLTISIAPGSASAGCKAASLSRTR